MCGFYPSVCYALSTHSAVDSQHRQAAACGLHNTSIFIFTLQQYQYHTERQRRQRQALRATRITQRGSFYYLLSTASTAWWPRAACFPLPLPASLTVPSYAERVRSRSSPPAAPLGTPGGLLAENRERVSASHALAFTAHGSNALALAPWQLAGSGLALRHIEALRQRSSTPHAPRAAPPAARLPRAFCLSSFFAPLPVVGHRARV